MRAREAIRRMGASGSQASCLCGQRASSLRSLIPAGWKPAGRTAWKAVFRLAGSLLRFFRSGFAPFALFCVLVPVLHAGVVRPAPPFTFGGAGGKNSLGSLRGQPVVLVIAQSGNTKALRSQLKSLKNIFHDCASRGAVFIAALADGGGTVPSDIPFAIASNGAAVAGAYGMRGDFLIAVIGRDGNLDFITSEPVPGARVFEVIKNNFDVQEKARRELPKGPPARP